MYKSDILYSRPEESNIEALEKNWFWNDKTYVTKRIKICFLVFVQDNGYHLSEFIYSIYRVAKSLNLGLQIHIFILYTSIHIYWAKRTLRIRDRYVVSLKGYMTSGLQVLSGVLDYIALPCTEELVVLLPTQPRYYYMHKGAYNKFHHDSR